MRCLDAAFLIDLLRKDGGAVLKAKEWDEIGEGLSVAAPALAEVLRGAYFRGGDDLRATVELVANLDVLVIDRDVAAEAGRLGAELLRRGEAMAASDLLIAAAAKLRQEILVTRDHRLARIPGLVVEGY